MSKALFVVKVQTKSMTQLYQLVGNGIWRNSGLSAQTGSVPVLILREGSGRSGAGMPNEIALWQQERLQKQSRVR